MGRAVPGPTGNQTTLSEDTTRDVTFEFGDGKRYRLTGTPPLKKRPNKASAGPTDNIKAGNKDNRALSQKENVDPLAKTADFVSSSGSSKAGKPERRTLADIHARVESDDSISLNGDRPRSHPANSRNTRFAGTRTHSSTLQHLRSNEHTQEPSAQDVTANSLVNGTHQSFMLPDLPNITELVSGVRQDGTPLINRSVKARSRFGTPSSHRRAQVSKPAHVPLDQVPASADDKALYLSLQLLQEKVVNLESEKKNMEDRAGDYELEVLQLRSKLQDQEVGKDRDGGLGLDAEEEKTREWEIERSSK